MNSKRRIILAFFLVLGLFFVVTGVLKIAQAAEPVQNTVLAGDLKDSDYDGLTDDAETKIYRTNPYLADTDQDGYLDSAEVLAKTDPLNFQDPSNPADSSAQNKASRLPWYISRSAAISSFVLMFLIIMLGTFMVTGFIYELISPARAWIIHKFLSISLGLTLLVHIMALLFDQYMAFKVPDILIPFFSGYKPLFLSLGITGFYILLVVVLGSLLIRLKFSYFWRATHYLVYPLFIFSLVHGIFMGPDNKFLATQLLYGITGTIFLIAVAYRFIFFRRSKSSA
jgi:methionine sulfoxide reductase heme-binding subunit